MSSGSWLANQGSLERRAANPQEISELLAVAERELGDAQIRGLSSDGVFEHAYNAARQCAKAALRACGYRVRQGVGHHRITIESLRHTMGTARKTVGRLNAFRRKRSDLTYDVAGQASEQEVSEMLALAEQLRKDVEDWLRENHPELLPSTRDVKDA